MEPIADDDETHRWPVAKRLRRLERQDEIRKHKRLTAVLNQIGRWERLNANRALLSGRKTLEKLKYEDEFIGRGIDQVCKDGLLPDLLAALRKKKKGPTDSEKQVRAAYSALCKDWQSRKDGQPRKDDPIFPNDNLMVLNDERTFRNLKKKIKEMFPGSQLSNHDRTLRYVVKNCGLPIKGKAGRPKK